MSAKMRQKVEREILTKLVDDALAAGHRLSVSLERGFDTNAMLLGSTERERIIEEALVGDECHIFVHAANGPLLNGGQIVSAGWVYLIYGNDGGCNVIADYSASVETLLAGANALADDFEGDSVADGRRNCEEDD